MIREFEHCGKQLIEWTARYLEEPRRYPVAARCQPGELVRAASAAPREGKPMESILREFETLILPTVTHWNHPRFHAYFSLTASTPGILGELLTAALDANAMLWKSCPAATELEQVATAWMLDWLRLPTDWFGMILDGASNAVLHAMVAARQCAEPESRAVGPSGRLIAYVSEHTHSSVVKAAITAGIGQSNVRCLAADSQFRMQPHLLEEAIRADLAEGRKPFFAVASVGTTSSAAIDPVVEIAAICRKYDVWLHVDGAYGGAFALLPECRHLFDGTEQADSFVVNAHKMLMVPLDCTLFYTCRPDVLRNAFSLSVEYLRTDAVAALDYTDYSFTLGRRFRALKLWMVMRYFGRDGLAAILREKLQLTAWLGERICSDGRFELLAPVTLSLVCFRLRAGDDATKTLMRRINDSGRFFVSHTKLNGHLAIRIAIGNIATNQQDIQELWATIAQA